jgi:hypothetical protein
MWHRVIAVAAVALLTVAGMQRAAAQDKRPDLDELYRFREIKGGKRAVQESPAAEMDKNKAAIRKVAQWHASRLMSAANKSLGSSDELPISTAVREFTADVLEPNLYTARMTLGQQDMIQIFGKDVMTALTPILDFKPPYGADKTLLMINAGRCIAALAKSGYEPLADNAVAIIDNPAVSDAIKLYYLHALKNLFAVPNPDRPEKSVFTDPQRELKAINSLIGFLTRKPTISPSAPQDEIDGYRYVRREALRALGMVRYPIVRVQGNVQTIPAIVLLRFANSDKSIVPPPSVSERAEGLIGYLQLAPDKEQNMDFSAGFVALAVRDLAVDYKAAKPPPPKGIDPKDLPKEPLAERDYMAWKLTATRISAGLKSWKDNWDNNLPPPRPADQARLVTGAFDQCETAVLKYINDGKRTEVAPDLLNQWLQNEKFPNNLMFSDDKSTFITRPEGP